MKIVLPLVGLVITLVVLSYIESPYSVINEKHARILTIPYEVAIAEQSEQVSVEPEEEIIEEAEESEEVPAQDYTLEMVLEGKSEIDDYIVETYREYEIYTDGNGQVIKKVPTSNYDYLRYQK